MHKTVSRLILMVIIILSWAATSLATWQVSLEISTPDPGSDSGVASNKLYIGTDPNATDGYDNQIDTLALLDGPIQAFISHPEYLSNQQKLWRDFRKDSLPQEFEFEVSSSAVNNLIKISWTIDAPNNIKFTLLDKDTNQEFTMASSSSYSYSNTSITPKKFLLRVTKGQGGNAGAGGAKGGGCGVIKDLGRKNRDGYGQIALNMIILMIPLLIPIRHYVRHYTFVTTRKWNDWTSLRG